MITVKTAVTSSEVGSVEAVLQLSHKLKATMKDKGTITLNGIEFTPKQVQLYSHLDFASITIEGYIA